MDLSYIVPMSTNQSNLTFVKCCLIKHSQRRLLWCLNWVLWTRSTYTQDKFVWDNYLPLQDCTHINCLTI